MYVAVTKDNQRNAHTAQPDTNDEDERNNQTHNNGKTTETEKTRGEKRGETDLNKKKSSETQKKRRMRGGTGDYNDFTQTSTRWEESCGWWVGVCVCKKERGKTK